MSKNRSWSPCTRAFGVLTNIILILYAIFNSVQLAEAVKKNPLKDSGICGRPQCDQSNNKFSYGNALYKYDYIVDLRSEFSGVGDNSSDLYLKINLDLLFPKPCEGFLRINEVRLWDNENSAQTDLLNDQEAVEAEKGRDTYDYYSNLEDEAVTKSPETSRNLHAKSSDLNNALREHILRFSFHDGLISEVCPNQNEAVWVLNFKKGILSTLQNTMMRFDVDFNTTETDVAGVCNVAYTLQSTENAFITINKVKDIASCRNRYAMHSILQTTPYNFRDDKTIWPILNSESHCSMTIDNNLYREVNCFERHQLIPFSNSSTGAVTTTRSKLTFRGREMYSVGEFLDKNNNLIERRSSLLFDHTPLIKPTHGEIKASRELLKEMCKVGFPNIQREFINIFTNFLQTTKSLDYKALSQLLARSASICESGRNHVLESLPYIGSTASYQLMRDQMIEHAIPTHIAHKWMTTLAFIQRPDEETLETFYTILEFSRRKIDPEYTLCASAVIHSYCKYNSECELNQRVKRITNLLETDFLNLFNMMRGKDRRTRERMIVILKGLGNIGVISDQFAEQLEEIIAEDIAPIDVRLQAVLTFRRADCLKYREFFMATYTNLSINAELRIHSYLQVMRCPDYLTINAIKKFLENKEEVKQVGSYVWSHLKNVAKSSSPARIEVQGLLLNDDLSDKFRMDIRKFSRNYEHSLFFDEYNFGSNTDVNLIFGTDSYLPRIFSLNYTADLFGQSVNFFEVTARAEGFEELASSVFGPKGPLNRDIFRKKLSFLNRWLGTESAEDDDTLQNFLGIDNVRSKRDALGEELDDNVDDYDDDYIENEYNNDRIKRSSNKSPSSESRRAILHEDVEDLGYKSNYNYDNPRAQIGLRVFGNDLRYYSLEGMMEIMAFFKEFDIIAATSKILSGEEIKYTKSNIFLDASYNVPLSVGLPLSIKAFGASSVDLYISGKLNRVEPIEDNWNFDVEGKIKPSVSVDVIGSMQSDLFYATSGIKVKSNLYSNSETEVNLKLRGRNLISFSFSLPKNRNEIFSARSELLIMKSTEELPQNGIEQRSSNTSCTWPLLDDAMGLKLCSYYSVPNLSEAEDTVYPGLLLSGPLDFSLILSKSDTTAKNYVFEYKWDQLENDSDWSLVFHTPGSYVKRLVVANVTTMANAFNASLTLVKDTKKAIAGCIYNSDPDNRILHIYFDANGRRSLDFNVELRRWQDRNVWVYQPRALLAVHGNNITGLVGTVRINQKNGIMQNDIDLSFETKKLQAILRGNFVQTEITTSTNMTINYRFQTNRVETINFAGKLINKGDKAKTEYYGNARLKTTAYPKLNFVSNATWLSLQGHTEGLITYNNAPNLKNPAYTNLVRFIFARSNSDELLWDGTRTRVSFEVKIPRSKVDVRWLVKHEERFKNGTEHNVVIGLRYAPEKEATALFSVHLPRRNLFALDAYMNVSIPDFNSCTARLKLTERSAKDYMINLNGTWFTGHLLAIKGNYRDKSSRAQAMHHLKLTIESPSFKPTTLNVAYRRNQLLIFGDVQAKYGADPYGLSVQYTGDAEHKNSNAEAKIKVKDKLYSINTRLLSEETKLLQVEVHLDKLRDIHLKVSLLSLEKKQELSLEFKWDANRDPARRLGLLAEYNHPSLHKYNGNVMITYPDRTISCGFDTFTGGPRYYGTVRASWSTHDMLVFSYDAGTVPGDNLNNWLKAELRTPFEGWHRNSLTAGVFSLENLILVNSSLLWADDQRLEVDLKSDYNIGDPVISFDIRVGVNSSVKDIPTMSIKLKHLQEITKIESDFELRYTTPNDILNVYNIRSNWDLMNSPNYQNISGTVLMLSPLEGYRKGGLALKFGISDNREIRGAASLTFDIREFTLAVDGYAKKFTDNMLTINITTPLQKFRTINARFGINENERHAVAEIRTDTAAAGIEVLCDVTSLMNFDVKFSLTTPVESFEQAAVVGKVKPETIDLRAAWNKAMLGFTGIWRMNNITDFEYAYLAFTPLKGFEENGFVAKLVNKESFALDLHGKFSDYKLGIKIDGHPKSKLLQQLGDSKLEFELLYDEDFQPVGTDDGEDYDVGDIEFFSYYAEFAVDTLIWPTVTAAVDVQEIRDFFLVVGNIQLPQGRIDIKDRLYYPDYINALNVLNIKTPFAVAKDIKSILEYHIDLNYNYFYDKVRIIVSNGIEQPTEVGFVLNYTKAITKETKLKQHDLTVKVKTSFEILENIEVIGNLCFNEKTYRGNITLITSNTQLSMAASVENDVDFLESSASILLDTEVVPDFGYSAYFKKDFAGVENSIVLQFEVADNGTNDRVNFETSWPKDISSTVNIHGKVETTMLPLKLAETSFSLIRGPNPQLNFDFSLQSNRGHQISYGARAFKKKDTFNVEIRTPISDFKNISMRGKLLQSPKDPQEYKVQGVLHRNKVIYDLVGTVKMSDQYPSDARLRLQPRKGGPDGIMELSINEPGGDQKGMNFRFSAGENGKMCQISGGLTLSDRNGMDFSILVESTEKQIARININGKLRIEKRGNLAGEINMETPWKEFGLQSVHLSSNINHEDDGGLIQGEYQIGDYNGRSSCMWSWIFAKNMQLVLENYMNRPYSKRPLNIYAAAKFLNPDENLHNLMASAKLMVNSVWNVEVNTTLNYLSADDFGLSLVTQLPRPIGDTHELSARYRGNVFSGSNQPKMFAEAKYEAVEAKRRYITRLSYRNMTDLQGLGHIEWGSTDDPAVIEGDFQMLRKPEVRRDFYAKLTTPKYKNRATVFIKGNYDRDENDYHKLICSLDHPDLGRIAEMDVAFKSLSNMKGYVNTSTPFFNVTWLKADFDFSYDGANAYKFCRVSWPTDMAFVKLRNSFKGKDMNHIVQGALEMEVPLSSRHRADIVYDLNENDDQDMGHIKVVYNGNEILDGLYKRTDAQSGTVHIQTTDITLENDFKPLGIIYINTRDLAQAQNTLDIKHVEVYELRNAKSFNLTGEIHTRTSLEGQELKLVAIHPNRTVILTTSYEETDNQVTKHRTKLELSKTAWIGYNIEIGNYSQFGNDSQKFLIELFYPKRNLSSEGWYDMTDDRFHSDISFKWTGSFYNSGPSVLRTGFVWQLEPLAKGDRGNQTLVLTIGHPYLEKDIEFRARYYRGKSDLLKTSLLIDYSSDPQHLIELFASLKDHAKGQPHTNYTFQFFAQHPASELEARIVAAIVAKPSFYKTEAQAFYKRDFYMQRRGKFLAKLDLNTKEIEYLRESPRRSMRLWIMPFRKHPVYGFNATVWDAPDTNNSGYFYIDLVRKFARMEINLTDDASQNLQMIGLIPDTRSAFLDIWRNYEEIRVIDVNSYINMNHSRLITGRIHWDPSIQKELRDKFLSVASSFYNSFSDSIDFWMKSLYTETTESIELVWRTIKIYNQRFFNDISELSLIEEDLNDLRTFLNQSYEANDFYIKTVINFTLSILDELAIRNHIESLPKIFDEIWQTMGDSGKALRKNIIGLIENIKSTYNRILEAIRRFFHGESLVYLTDFLEKVVEKYDKFIKDLHISFIKYVEKLWNRGMIITANYWKNVLKRIEPYIFKFISFIEETAWNLSKELFDFIHKRSSELAETPYFNKVSNFTQDVDNLYKDIKSNDALTNIKKYSLIIWNFLKEKYFKVVPFATELNDILTEIWDEIKKLQKIEQIKLILEKCEELKEKMHWFADELQMELRLHQFYALIRNKLRHYALNALETSDMYREAKTKFVYDPNVGVMDLEQKLPMSWHAFNETPKFEEMPEYKVLAKAQNIFMAANSSLIRYIYNIRNYFDPKTWLPPYSARALLIGSRHFITFDQRFVAHNEPTETGNGAAGNLKCSYVLAHDFFGHNFTLILEPTPSPNDLVVNKKLSFLANEQLIEIDIKKNSLSINGNTNSLLPIQLDDVTIYRDLNVLTIHSGSDFILNCNIQYDLCWFELSGWYFGRTAGLLGTMNNEPYDDFTTSGNSIVRNVDDFTSSWSLRNCKEQNRFTNQSAVTASAATGFDLETCHQFFQMGFLSACSDTIDMKPFYEMCLDLTIHATSLNTDQQPSVKGACTAALAYIEACAAARIPLRVPEQCIYCQLTNGSYVPEGTFIGLKGPEIPHSTDVVFIIEAKPCNANLTENKNIIGVASSIEEHLQRAKITHNRYAVVAFGGQTPFDRPRAITHKNRVFTTELNELRQYFNHIITSNSSNNDILQAISIASKLNFRPGVSKTFILLSCSKCAARHMRFDYTSILQYMLEEGVKLHILADTQFDFERSRKLRHFFGLDRDLVYSKRYPEGDKELRKQLRIPKSSLGICTPLALETNGSIFSGHKLMPNRKYPVKRIANIFAKRVAESALPIDSQICECTGHNNGLAYMACSPSKLPTGQTDFDDYDWLFSNWEWDDGDDDEHVTNEP